MRHVSLPFSFLDTWPGYLHQNHRAKGADRVIIDAPLADGRIGCSSFPFLGLTCMAARCLILVPGLGVPRKAPVMTTGSSLTTKLTFRPREA